MSFNEMSRMSRIDDHNRFLPTDHLYEPLRNALRKSVVQPSNSFLSPPAANDHRLSQSRLARASRSLSPAEADLIVNSC